MFGLVPAWFFLLGTVIGSFLNVVVYRLHTGRSVNGRSHCLSCGKYLAWYELIPIVSYLAQRGRCRGCGAHITVRYAAVEALTGVLFLLIARHFLFDSVLLALNLGSVALLVVIVAYDLRHTIIPDELVLYLSAFAVAYILWNPLTHSVALPSPETILGGVLPALFFWGLWLISGGRWVGLGDAKLIFPLGLMVGAWGSVSLFILAFWIGAVTGVGILAMQTLMRVVMSRGIPRRGFRFLATRLTTTSEEQDTRLHVSYPSAGVAKYHRCFTMKSEVPFAPFLVVAFFLVQLAQVDVLALVAALMSLVV